MARRFVTAIVAVAITLLLPTYIAQAQQTPDRPVIRIGIVRDGPPVRFLSDIEMFRREILDLTSEEFDVQFPQDKNIHGSWTANGVKQAVDRLLGDPEVDLVITLGVIASHEVCQRRDLPKPVIAALTVDPELQGLPLKDGTSGVRNLTYIDSFKSLKSDVKAFNEIVPFKTLAVLADGAALKAIPQISDYAQQIARELSIRMSIIVVENTAEEALAALPPDTDAVLVAPLVRLAPSEFQKLVAGLIDRRLPSFSFWGSDEVVQGLLASVAPKSDFPRLARRVALNVQRVLLGEDPGTFPVAFPVGERLTINMATARAIGAYPSWGVLIEAELLNEEREDIERHLTMESAIHEAVAVNLDLAVSERDVAAGRQRVREVLAELLPQIEISTSGLFIDKERAEASLGGDAERTFSGSASATQLIYSDDAWANYTIEKYSQISREEERDTLRLDIARAAVIAYLNVLRAKTLERVQKDNLKLTRANLDTARVRQSVGVANPAEVFRWESEIATSRQNVLDAQFQRRQAQLTLNRLLHRPMEERFLTAEAGLDDPSLLISDERFFRYIDNPQTSKVFRDFMVQEGFEAAPELRRLLALISGQERERLAAQRAFYLPTFSVRGSITQIYDEAGAGAGRSSLPILLPEDEDSEWSVTVDATLPIFSGGAKDARLKLADEELARLRLEREATVERIEERIRTALQKTDTSFPSIRLSQQGAESARRNLDLVRDQYERGVVSIIDLLDAQNASLVADQVAANAVFDYLIDLMEAQRAVGRFDFFLSTTQREEWFQRLDAFFTQTGVKPREQ
jgi:outer membrane protein